MDRFDCASCLAGMLDYSFALPIVDFDVLIDLSGAGIEFLSDRGCLSMTWLVEKGRKEKSSNFYVRREGHRCIVAGETILRSNESDNVRKVESAVDEAGTSNMMKYVVNSAIQQCAM